MGGLLQGKRVLITGASRGIGAAVAELCASEGAELLLTARSEDKLQEVAKRCHDAGAAGCECLKCDVADPASIEQLAAGVLERHGWIDVLVNNAGTGAGDQNILTGNPDDWEVMLATNTLAPMRFTRLFAPAMASRGGGLIVNVGSLAGRQPSANSAAYNASKHGIRGWTLGCYETLRSQNIKTMVIEPGFVATDMVLHTVDLHADLCIQPTDIAEAAMLPLQLSPNAVPLEVLMRVVLSPYKKE